MEINQPNWIHSWCRCPSFVRESRHRTTVSILDLLMILASHGTELHFVNYIHKYHTIYYNSTEESAS